MILLNNCQLNEPNKIHGVNFLENREKALILGKTNKNDVIKLGQNVLKENKVLELKFDKFGILITKKIHNKNDMNKVKYSKKETENNVSQQSFVGKFLSSVRQKMYGRGRKF